MHSAGPLGSQGPDENPPTEEWKVGTRSHPRALIAIAVGVLVVGLLVASLLVLYPYLEENYYGPAPAWHTFNPVFSSSGQVVSEACSLNDLQPILGGVGGVGRPTQTSVVICSFHGASYSGYYGYDCNQPPSGLTLSVNGSVVPPDGCVLGQTPLNYTFVNLFTFGPKTNVSIAIFSGDKVSANLTLTQSWKSFACYIRTNNITRSNGPLSCQYLGVKYLATDVLQACDITRAVRINGNPIPQDSCNLERADLVGLSM